MEVPSSPQNFLSQKYKILTIYFVDFRKILKILQFFNYTNLRNAFLYNCVLILYFTPYITFCYDSKGYVRFADFADL